MIQDAPNNKLLIRFAQKVASGAFKDKPLFMDFTSAMVTLAEHQECGHGLQGMHYPPAFDKWCHELFVFVTSSTPCVLRSLQQQIRAKLSSDMIKNPYVPSRYLL